MKVKFKIIRNFIDKSLAFDLHNWVLGQKNLTLWNKPSYHIGGYRFFDPSNTVWEKDEHERVLKPIENIREEFLNLRSKISNLLNFANEHKSKNLTSFVSVIRKESFVDLHYDSTIDGYDHIRCNVILNNVENSSLFIVNGKKYDLSTGDLVSFPANLLEHGTTIHESEDPRTLLSYGFLISNLYK